MQGLIWILLFVLALGFIAGYRYGKGRHSLGPILGNGSNPGDVANGLRAPWRRIENGKLIDPVCHKAVSQERAKLSAHQDVIYYFCSRECREIFETAPDLYVSTRAPQRSATNT